MKYIKKNNKYNKTELAEIKYGLISIYLTFSKIIFIIMLSIILGIFKEVIIFMILFNILRTTAFGLHATKSWICWISSTIIFIGIPVICINIEINIIIKALMLIINVILIFKNSPADTKNKPIVKKKRRLIYKYLSTILAIIFSFISIIIKNNFISNGLLFSLILENSLISPVTYKIFKLPYNNYIEFLKTHPNFSN